MNEEENLLLTSNKKGQRRRRGRLHHILCITFYALYYISFRHIYKEEEEPILGQEVPAQKLKEKASIEHLQTLDINTAGVSSSSTNKLVL